MATLAEQLATHPAFCQQVEEEKSLKELKEFWAGQSYSAGTVARAYHIVRADDKNFCHPESAPETTEPMNDPNTPLLADVGTPLPIDDASTIWTPPEPVVEDDTQDDWSDAKADAEEVMREQAWRGDFDEPPPPMEDEEEEVATPLLVGVDMAGPPENPISAAVAVNQETGKVEELQLTANVDGIPQMSQEDARHALSAIRGNEMRLQAQLVEFKARRGHFALGYKNWEEFLEAEFDIKSRQHFDYLTKCGETYGNLMEAFDISELRRLKNSHLAALSELPDKAKQQEALTLALARVETTTYRGKASHNNGKLTERIVADVVSEILAPTMTEKANKALPARGTVPPVTAPQEPTLPFDGLAEEETDPFGDDIEGSPTETALRDTHASKSQQGDQSCPPPPFAQGETPQSAETGQITAEDEPFRNLLLREKVLYQRKTACFVFHLHNGDGELFEFIILEADLMAAKAEACKE